MRSAFKILRFKDWIFNFDVPVIEPGEYVMRFNFQLPDDLPSSLYFKKMTREAPKAKVKYYIKVSLECEHPKFAMVYKQVLIIREKPLDLSVGTTIEEASQLKTWGCCS